MPTKKELYAQAKAIKSRTCPAISRYTKRQLNLYIIVKGGKAPASAPAKAKPSAKPSAKPKAKSMYSVKPKRNPPAMLKAQPRVRSKTTVTYGKKKNIKLRPTRMKKKKKRKKRTGDTIYLDDEVEENYASNFDDYQQMDYREQSALRLPLTWSNFMVGFGFMYDGPNRKRNMIIGYHQYVKQFSKKKLATTGILENMPEIPPSTLQRSKKKPIFNKNLMNIWTKNMKAAKKKT